jgi:acyl-CoA thioester hydrolase
MIHPFRYYLRVRYQECDAQKVVFNARYSDYIDIAITEFIRAIGFGEALMNGELDFQLVKQTIEWQAPAHFDDVLELAVTANRLGNTSFTLGVTIRRAVDEKQIATAETVYVLVAAATLTKTPLPLPFRSALEQGAPDHQTDHAGYL